MKKTLPIIFLLISNIIFCQSNFNNGFNDGYKKGYCQDKGIGCLAPIPPIPPIPEIGENSNSYQDGYNRGFKVGMQANSGTTNSSNTRERYKTTSAQFVDDFVYNPYKDPNVLNLAMKVAELKAQKLKSLFDKATESYNDDDYANAIYFANEIIKTDANIPQAYAIKAMSYFYKNEIINAYNNICKAESLRYSGEDNIKFIKEETSKYLKERMSNGDYRNVSYFGENVWYPNDFSNYYLGLAYYYQEDFKQAKKAFKKVKNFEPAKQYITAIDKNQKIQNPFQTSSSNPISTSNSSNNDLQKISEYYKSKNYDKILNILQPLEKSIEIGKISDSKAILFVYANKTYCNYYLKNYSKAISDATMAINNYNGNETASLYFIRAMAKTELKDYYGANSDFDYLIDNYSKLNFKETSLGTLINNKAYNFILLKDFKSAKPLVDKALLLEKNTDYIWDTKGELEYYLGNYKESIIAMTNSLNLTKRANSYFYRGLSNIKIGKKADGCSDLSKAGELGESKAYEEINKFCK